MQFNETLSGHSQDMETMDMIDCPNIIEEIPQIEIIDDIPDSHDSLENEEILQNRPPEVVIPLQGGPSEKELKSLRIKKLHLEKVKIDAKKNHAIQKVQKIARRRNRVHK
jgi:hypothetical protein